MARASARQGVTSPTSSDWLTCRGSLPWSGRSCRVVQSGLAPRTVHARGSDVVAGEPGQWRVVAAEFVLPCSFQLVRMSECIHSCDGLLAAFFPWLADSTPSCDCHFQPSTSRRGDPSSVLFLLRRESREVLVCRRLLVNLSAVAIRVRSTSPRLGPL